MDKIYIDACTGSNAKKTKIVLWNQEITSKHDYPRGELGQKKEHNQS